MQRIAMMLLVLQVSLLALASCGPAQSKTTDVNWQDAGLKNSLAVAKAAEIYHRKASKLPGSVAEFKGLLPNSSKRRATDVLTLLVVDFPGAKHGAPYYTAYRPILVQATAVVTGERISRVVGFEVMTYGVSGEPGYIVDGRLMCDGTLLVFVREQP